MLIIELYNLIFMPPEAEYHAAAPPSQPLFPPQGLRRAPPHPRLIILDDPSSPTDKVNKSVSAACRLHVWAATLSLSVEADVSRSSSSAHDYSVSLRHTHPVAKS